MIDKIKIKGEFFIDIISTNIYNRFHRKFRNSFKDFDFSPNDIIQLSKFNPQKMAKVLYYKSLFIKI